MNLLLVLLTIENLMVLDRLVQKLWDLQKSCSRDPGLQVFVEVIFVTRALYLLQRCFYSCDLLKCAIPEVAELWITKATRKQPESQCIYFWVLHDDTPLNLIQTRIQQHFVRNGQFSGPPSVASPPVPVASVALHMAASQKARWPCCITL